MSDLCSGRRRTDWTCLQPVACFKHALLSSQVHDTVHCVPTMTTAPTMSMLSLARSTVVFICRATHPRHSERAQADPTILVQGHLLAMEIDASASLGCVRIKSVLRSPAHRSQSSWPESTLLLPPWLAGESATTTVAVCSCSKQARDLLQHSIRYWHPPAS